MSEDCNILRSWALVNLNCKFIPFSIALLYHSLSTQIWHETDQIGKRLHSTLITRMFFVLLILKGAPGLECFEK